MGQEQAHEDEAAGESANDHFHKFKGAGGPVWVPANIDNELYEHILIKSIVTDRAVMSKNFSPRDLSDDALQLVAARFRTLGEPNRLKLLIVLEQGPKRVTELMQATGLLQANVSRHLQSLTEAGLLARERQGTAVIYSIADPSIFDLCHQVCGGIQKRLQQQAKAFG